MKIIDFEDFTFNNVTDPVSTEFLIYSKIKQNYNLLPENLNYVAIPLAYTINTKGLNYTQYIIDNVQNKYPNIIKKFVCQHIDVKKLNFFNNKIYTPHCLLSDSFYVIPHFNSIVKESDYINFKSRTYKFSFIGAMNSHPIRVELSKYNNNKDILIRDTGTWHFYKDENNKKKYSQKYLDILTKTKFSLCPQGTGVSTIRLYESMACGSIPIVFNDVKVPNIIEKYIIRLKNVSELLNIFEDDKYIVYSNELKNIYWEHLSNDNMYKGII